MISYRHEFKNKATKLLYTVRSLVMVRNQLPAQVVKLYLVESKGDYLEKTKLTDFNDLEICSQDHYSEQPCPTHITGIIQGV